MEALAAPLLRRRVIDTVTTRDGHVDFVLTATGEHDDAARLFCVMIRAATAWVDTQQRTRPSAEIIGDLLHTAWIEKYRARYVVPPRQTVATIPTDDNCDECQLIRLMTAGFVARGTMRFLVVDGHLGIERTPTGDQDPLTRMFCAILDAAAKLGVIQREDDEDVPAAEVRH
jgi:hypothetical protein